MNKFVARYIVNGISKSIAFDKTIFSEDKAKEFLNHNGIKNFFFFFDPYEPEQFSENSWLFKGDIGFDITTEKLLPYLRAGNEIIIDSFGGDLWEGLKIYDTIKSLGTNPSIGVLGSCASAATLILLSTSNRWMTENSRFLIHNPWTWEAGDDDKFRKTANELEQEKNKIAKIYALETGGDINEILSIMKEERFMDTHEALTRNFITSKNNKFNLKDDDMKDNEVKEKLSSLETMISGIKSAVNKLVGNSPKNIVIQDTNGVELEFPEAETEEQIAVDMPVNVNGEAGQTGEYTKDDGTVYVVADGVLTEIKPASDSDTEMEALKAENADLKEQLANIQNSLTSVEGERDGLKASLHDVSTQVEAVKNELSSFKNKFSDDKPKPNAPASKNSNKNKRR